MSFVRVLAILAAISLPISSENAEDVLKTISKKYAEIEFEDSSVVISQIEICDDSNPCENGGKCVQEVCNCLEGTSGPMCKTIDECRGRSKCGEEADCLFNVTSLEAYCKCSNSSLAFNDVAKTCSECDCGAYQIGCSYVQGKQQCDCMDNYAQRYSICTYCDCGVHGNCSFKPRLKSCECLDGYSNNNGICTECTCGNDTGCAFGEDSKQFCYCRDGYQLKDGVCTECDCGNGLCSFDKWGKKKCVCNTRSSEFNGTCKKCECEDDNSRCSFDSWGGEKYCFCLDGYAINNGTCTECNCGSNALCSFHRGEKNCHCSVRSLLVDGICRECDCDAAATRCTVTRGGKICSCIEGFADNLGKCARCDCGMKAKSCTFNEGRKVCTCLDGYTDLEGLCTDCNCGSNGTCSLGDYWGQKGYLGTKTCYCDQGYVEYEGRCKDICDEGKCNNGVCVATGFNFTCICNQGFTGLLCDERIIKNIFDVSGAIIVSVILCVANVGVFIATLCLVRRNRKLKKILLQQTKDNCQR